MHIDEREINNIVIFDVDGKIDIYEAPELKNRIIERIEEERVNIIVNLKKVSSIDSSGIGALIACVSDCKKNRGTLKIINIQDTVRKTFELTKISSYFEIFDNEEQALASFG